MELIKLSRHAFFALGNMALNKKLRVKLDSIISKIWHYIPLSVVLSCVVLPNVMPLQQKS
jgi:hypothetical protein